MDQGKRSESLELIAVVIFGLMLKLFAGRNSFAEQGIILPGYDEYYHMRRILHGVGNFPDVLWFDSYLNYPHGLPIGWPPLFDQLSAALCVALGQHTRSGVEMAAAFVPVILGLLAMVVVYYTMRELFDHRIALLSSFMTALAPNHLRYTMVAATDHHSLEVLLQLLSLLFLILAISRPERRWLYASAGGVALAALAYTWLGADAYFGAYLLIAAVAISLELQAGSSLKIAPTMIVAFILALVLVFPYRNMPWMSPSFLGLAAILVSLAVMLALAMLLAGRNISWRVFPLAVMAISFVFLLLAKPLGGLFGVEDLIRMGSGYIWGGEMIGRISEAEPLIYDRKTFSQVLFSGLGLKILLSLAGAAATTVRLRRQEGKKRQMLLFFLLWALYSIVLTLGQSRFLYISTIYMGILISILIFHALDYARKVLGENGKKVHLGLSVAIIFLLLLPMAIDAISFVQNNPPPVEGDWYESILWLKENSNATSFYADPQAVPEYSVMSWWDYGNWILYLSERPVVANNFQSGVEDAVRFYLAEDEAGAAQIMDARGARYVFADYSTVFSKLASLAEWGGEDVNSYMVREDYGNQIKVKPKDRLLNTTLGRLYLVDGAGMGRFRLIYESRTVMGSNPGISRVKIFQYVPGALLRIHAAPDQNAGVLLNVTSNMERKFIYVNQASWNGDLLELRVPYSTEKRYETHALDPYLVFSGNENGIKVQNVEISEEDVLQGRTIELNL